MADSLPSGFASWRTTLRLDPHRRQVTFHYFGHVLGCDAGIPDVVGVDEDDGTYFVAAGADVAEHGGRRYVAQLHLFPEQLEQFAAPLRTAAFLARCGANEDLAQLAHAQILCRSQEKSRRVAATALSGPTGHQGSTPHPLMHLCLQRTPVA